MRVRTGRFMNRQPRVASGVTLSLHPQLADMSKPWRLSHSLVIPACVASVRDMCQ